MTWTRARQPTGPWPAGSAACVALLLLGGACRLPNGSEPQAAGSSSPAPFHHPAAPGEEHLSGLRQMTFGGQNAEAYWSFDDRQLIFQSTRDDLACDQIFLMDVATGVVQQITHEGRTTCPYFLPDGQHILYASTHEGGPHCPPEPDRSAGYVWPLYPSYDIFVANRDGSGRRNITRSPGYDAEATVSRDGRILFTSTRSGDLELWTMNADGGDLKQITHEPGYDGGGFFSPDGTKICWRASRFDDPEARREYFDLLGQDLVRPSQMEIYVADADGSNVVQLTRNGRANFAPYFTPGGSEVLFCSNVNDPRGRLFDIYQVDLDGSHVERITYNNSFDGFPMFSWDGRRLAFSSNRFGAVPGETNVFIADWEG